MARKWQQPCCSRCGHPDYVEGIAPGDGRPDFTCVLCGYHWTYGRDGGIYTRQPQAPPRPEGETR